MFFYRIDNKLTIQCDTCLNFHEANTANPVLAQASAIKYHGFKVYRDGKNWIHACSDCYAKWELRMSKNRIVDLKYDHIVHQTEAAYLFEFGGKEVWLPKSWVELDERDSVISIPEHRAIEKEIEGFAV